LRRRGRTLPRHQREPDPQLEASSARPGRTGFPRTRQPLSLRGGGPSPPRREQAAAGGARHPKKSDGVLRQGGDMTYRFIDDHKDLWPVRLLCETLEVSAAGYYAWRQRPRSAQEQWHDILLVEIRAIHTEVKGRYGSPRMHKELVARG